MTLTYEYSFKGRIFPELQKLNIMEHFLTLYSCRFTLTAGPSSLQLKRHGHIKRNTDTIWSHGGFAAPSSLQRVPVMVSCWTLGRLAIRDQSSLNEIVYFGASLWSSFKSKSRCLSSFKSKPRCLSSFKSKPRYFEPYPMKTSKEPLLSAVILKVIKSGTNGSVSKSTTLGGSFPASTD